MEYIYIFNILCIFSTLIEMSLTGTLLFQISIVSLVSLVSLLSTVVIHRYI